MNSNNIAIKVENISKVYRIGAKENIHDSFVHTMIDFLKSPWKNYRKYRSLYKFDDITPDQSNSSSNNSSDIIWALKDVSFEVKRGEVLGIIGRNGAGKSTILKVLSKITEPTGGYAEIHGRVSSLLEVGTGFHQELTGRENIYLNGTVLGMTKKEVDSKFEEIVDFSGVEKFINTPVKRYSSGMKVRLAFSVAAHLEPEILIVDEVLAVGDAAFQKKCVGKMGDIAKRDRATILFVSHNIMAIQSLCTKAILMEHGTIDFEGPTDQTVSKYISSVERLNTQPLHARQDRVGGEVLRFTSVQFLNPQTMTPWKALVSGQPVVVRISYLCRSKNVLKGVGFAIIFLSMAGAHLFACRNKALGVTHNCHMGEGYTDCMLPKWPLKAGRYSYNLAAEQDGTTLDWIKDADTFTVENGDYYGSGCLPAPNQTGVLIDYTWQHDLP